MGVLARGMDLSYTIAQVGVWSRPIWWRIRAHHAHGASAWYFLLARLTAADGKKPLLAAPGDWGLQDDVRGRSRRGAVGDFGEESKDCASATGPSCCHSALD